VASHVPRSLKPLIRLPRLSPNFARLLSQVELSFCGLACAAFAQAADSPAAAKSQLYATIVTS